MGGGRGGVGKKAPKMTSQETKHKGKCFFSTFWKITVGGFVNQVITKILALI